MPLAVTLARGHLAAESDDLGITVELFSPALTTSPLHAFFALDRCHGCPPRVLPWGNRVFHATHASPSAHDGLGFTCHGRRATPLTSEINCSALRAVSLAQGPSGKFAENHQFACSLLLRPTQSLGHVLRGPVGPIDVQRSSPPASPLVMSPDIDSMGHASGCPSAVMSAQRQKRTAANPSVAAHLRSPAVMRSTCLVALPSALAHESIRTSCFWSGVHRVSRALRPMKRHDRGWRLRWIESISYAGASG
jgi:hypothetical protein